jgi:hypothetical protein
VSKTSIKTNKVPRPSSLSSNPLSKILKSPVKTFVKSDDTFAREWAMFERGDVGFLLAKGISPHQFADYFRNYHSNVNVFDPSSLAQKADAKGYVRLDTGSLMHVPSNTVTHGSIAPAPTHLIDYCRGGQVTGVVPVNNTWYTVNNQGHLLAPVGPTWLYPGQ